MEWCLIKDRIRFHGMVLGSAQGGNPERHDKFYHKSDMHPVHTDCAITEQYTF